MFNIGQFKNFSPSDHDLPCNDVIGEYFMTSSLILPSSSGSRGPRQWRTERGCWRVQTPPEIPKTFQNRAKLNLIVKTVKNC